jgi:hypothetical protein
MFLLVRCFGDVFLGDLGHQYEFRYFGLVAAKINNPLVVEHHIL